MTSQIARALHSNRIVTRWLVTLFASDSQRLLEIAKQAVQQERAIDKLPVDI